ncbi:MAG: hypothetical protein FD143_3036 [Ignavibacteria bacterium]|nr:MAG: hypothetical protein FD143_3036 [Ignavibacteria bacterium]
MKSIINIYLLLYLFLALRDKLIDGNLAIPEEAEKGTPGDVALFSALTRGDWTTVKTRRALKRLHFEFTPRQRIDMRPFSQQDGNPEQVVVDDADDETVSIASTVLLTPTSSLEVLPSTSPTTTPGWLHTHRRLHRN